MEQEIYVKEMPKSYSKCEWCTLNHKDNYGRPFCLMARMPLYNGDRVNEERGQHKDSLSDFDCPLHSIKDHDQELVRQVCEKIREYLRRQVIYCGGKATELDIMIANAGNQVLEDIKQFLIQIQKEFEDE